jgi:UDP-N-acetylglucosamine 2-epimerase (non-hydrolysing)
VLVVVGTRPEAIKMAPVVRALRARAPSVETRVCLTGQHTSLVDQVLEAFDLRPDFDLDIMKEGQTLYDVVHEALDGLRAVVRECRPDVLLVQGDTATVFVGALVGFFERVKVGHVEAGLRSHDKWAPYPEEIFRRLSDVLSDYYFAPTTLARDALLAEGVPEAQVHVTGNTVVDALLSVAERDFPVENGALASVLFSDRRMILLTAHRRESFGAPLRDVFAGVRELVDAVPDVELIYPVHPNPNVRGPAEELLAGHPRIHLTQPLGYLDIVTAMRSADLILTDSGGIPAGVAELVGTDADRIVERGLLALGRGPTEDPPANPYGDGRAGERIAEILVSDLEGRRGAGHGRA